MIWYLKQLIPLTYRSKYRNEKGENHFVVWKMFLGKCYQIEDYKIG